jgi:hypothetical protein
MCAGVYVHEEQVKARHIQNDSSAAHHLPFQGRENDKRWNPVSRFVLVCLARDALYLGMNGNGKERMRRWYCAENKMY